MDAYLKLVQTLATDFEFFELTKVPRGKNVCADALTGFGRKLRNQVKRTIPINRIERPSINLSLNQTSIVSPVTEATSTEEDSTTEQAQASAPDWRKKIIDYLIDGKLPPEKWVARRLKPQSAYYVFIEGNLHRWTATKVLLKFLHGEETRLLIAETHEGAVSNHSGGRALALKIKSLCFIGRR